MKAGPCVFVYSVIKNWWQCNFSYSLTCIFLVCQLRGCYMRATPVECTAPMLRPFDEKTRLDFEPEVVDAVYRNIAR
jgi:hypothetical protein